MILRCHILCKKYVFSVLELTYFVFSVWIDLLYAQKLISICSREHLTEKAFFFYKKYLLDCVVTFMVLLGSFWYARNHFNACL